MNMRTPDLAVLVIYFLGVTLAGLWFARRNRTTEEYFLGNRNFPAWAIGLSLVGTSISSVTFLAYPADAYKTAWLRMLPNFMLPVGILVASRVFLPFFRRGNVTSAFEYLEGRFGPSTRLYGALAFIVGQLVRISLILYLVSLLMHEATGIDVTWCIILAGVFVSFYTIAGGIEAVVWTDVIQTIILVVGGAACLLHIVVALPGGFGEIISTAVADGKLAFADPDPVTGELVPAPWDLSLVEKTASMMLLIGLTNWLAEYSANQNVVQRYCASRSIRDARRAMWVCAWSSVPIWGFFMFLGTSLYVYYQVFPTPDAQAMLDGTAKAEQILPYFVLRNLWPGFAGLVIAAVLAAAMSSLDSSLNAISTVSVVDVYRRRIMPLCDDRHYLMAARLIGIGAAVFMVGGALVLAEVESQTLQDTATKISAVTAGGLLGLFGLGFLTRVGDARAAGVAIAATLLFSVYRALEAAGGPLSTPSLPIDPYYTGLLGHALMFVIGYGLGLLLPRRERDLTNLTVWTQDKDGVH